MLPSIHVTLHVMSVQMSKSRLDQLGQLLELSPGIVVELGIGAFLYISKALANVKKAILEITTQCMIEAFSRSRGISAIFIIAEVI